MARRRTRTFDHALVLLSQRVTTDDLANQVKEEVQTEVLCDVDSIGSSEFYEAKVQGLKPEKTFVINYFEYSGQSTVEFNGDKYQVIRTYDNEYEETELTCERFVGR